MEPIVKRSYSEIKEFCDEIAEENECTFYRGTKVGYLSPSIVPSNKRLDTNELTRIEKKLLKIFKLIYPGNFTNADKTTNNWLLRIKAREYGLASRLIDWANFFHTALEFATNFHEDQDKCYKYVYLWILTVDESELLFNNDLKNYPIEKLTSSYILRGVRYTKKADIATRRQSVQGGNFLVQPTECLTTQLNEQSYFSNKLSCLKIPVEKIGEIRKDLAKDKKIDIESHSLLIDNCWLDSACNVLCNKFLYSANKIRTSTNLSSTNI